MPPPLLAACPAAGDPDYSQSIDLIREMAVTSVDIIELMLLIPGISKYSIKIKKY
jgi:hypothetical protein